MDMMDMMEADPQHANSRLAVGYSGRTRICGFG